MTERRVMPVVLLVDDTLSNLLMLQDVLEESGYNVLSTQLVASAFEMVEAVPPDIILISVDQFELDALDFCFQLKRGVNTQHIPIILMMSAEQSEQDSVWQANVDDYLVKPARTSEVLVRVRSQLKIHSKIQQVHSALDAYGQATVAILPSNGKIVWSTPLATKWLGEYFHLPPGHETAPSSLLDWLKSERSANPLVSHQENKQLRISWAGNSSDELILLILNESSEHAQLNCLISQFDLTRREAEVLYWLIRGKTTRDIADILGNSPRTINKHLEHVYIKLGVENRTAAADLVRARLKWNAI